MSLLPSGYIILAIVGLSIVLVWAMVKMAGQIVRRQPPKMKYSIPFFLSLVIAIGIIKVQRDLISIAIALVSIGVSLLIFAIVKLVKQEKNNREIKVRHFIALFISLLVLEVIYCFYLAMKIGLGHRNITLESEFTLQCLLSFILIVVLPIVGMLIYKYTRSKRKTLVFFLIYSLVFVLSSIYTAPGTSAALKDQKGNPVTDAYVFYHRGYHFLFSNWGTLRFTKTERDGHFSIPMFINICLPFEYSFGFEKPFVDDLPIKIYAPRLNNFCNIKDVHTWHFPGESRIRKIEKRGNEPSIVLDDLSDNPDQCYFALNQAVFHTSVLKAGNSLKEKREILSAIKKQYDWFVLTYGDVPRGSQEEITWGKLLKRGKYGRSIDEEITRLLNKLAGKPKKPAAAREQEPLISMTGDTETRPIQSPVLKWSLKHTRAEAIPFHDVDKDGIPDLIICGLLKPPREFGYITVFSGKTLSPIWEFESKAFQFFPPAIDNGLLYCITKNIGPKFSSFTVVNALDLYSGRKIWEYRPDSRDQTEGRPFVGDKYIYFHGGNIYIKTSYIYALDKENGTLKWGFELDIPLSRRVNIGKERLYFSGSGKEDPTESYIACIDLKTREVLWKYHLPESPVGIGLVSSAPIVAGDLLFWISPENYLYAIDIADGRQKWRYKAPMGVNSFALKGNLAFICSKGIYAIDIREGRLLWQFAPEILFYSNLCFVGDVGYAGTVDGHVYALNLEDGKKLWHFEIGGYITSISSIDSILAVISSARDLYILGDQR